MTALLCLMLANALTARAADPAAALSATPSPVTFNDVQPGGSASQLVHVTNTGTANTTIREVANVGRDRNDFAVVADGCTGQVVTPGASCPLTLRFAPQVAGTRITSIRISGDDVCTYWVNAAGGGSMLPSPATPRASTCAAVTTTTAAPATTTTTTSASAASTSPPAAAGATTPGVALSSVALPSDAICRSRRSITLHVRPKRGLSYRRVVIRVDGRTLRTINRSGVKPLVASVVLHGLPRGRVAVRVIATDTAGKRHTRTQHFVTCVKR